MSGGAFPAEAGRPPCNQRAFGRPREGGKAEPPWRKLRTPRKVSTMGDTSAKVVARASCPRFLFPPAQAVRPSMARSVAAALRASAPPRRLPSFRPFTIIAPRATTDAGGCFSVRLRRPSPSRAKRLGHEDGLADRRGKVPQKIPN